MPNYIVALLFATGGGAWIYNKMLERTGGNKPSALTVAVSSGVVLFLFMMIVMWTVGNFLES